MNSSPATAGAAKTQARAAMSALAWSRTRDGWLMVIVVVLGTILFDLSPIVMSFITSFTDWNAVTLPKFNGLDNYRALVQDKTFLLTVKNTIYYTAAHVPLAMAAGLGLALLVNRKIRGINIFRAAFFIPVIASTVAVGIIWKWVLGGYGGLLNSTLAMVGIKGPDWLASTTWAMPAVILVSVWQSMGYNMIIYLAGLQNVPQELYEAASIDGAGKRQQFWKITLPMLSPVTFFLSIMSFISSFQAFGLIFMMTSGGPANSTNVYIYYVYESAFSFFKAGYASAMAWILFVVIAGITLIQWKLSKRWVHYQ